MLAGQRELLNKSGLHLFMKNDSPVLLGQEINRGEKIRLGIDPEDLFKDLFSTGIDDQPVVDNRDTNKPASLLQNGAW